MKKTDSPTRGLKNQEISQYNLLLPLLDSLVREMKQLSSKKQDLQLNKLKIRKINEILTQTKDLLQGEPTGQFLELLDEALMPTNSDAVLIMTQHQTAMSSFHDRYNRRWVNEYKSEWLTEELAERLTSQQKEARDDDEENDDSEESDEDLETDEDSDD